MRRCQFCGQLHPANAEFCPITGRRLRSARAGGAALLLLVGMLGLGMVASGFWYWCRDRGQCNAVIAFQPTQVVYIDPTPVRPTETLAITAVPRPSYTSTATPIQQVFPTRAEATATPIAATPTRAPSSTTTSSATASTLPTLAYLASGQLTALVHVPAGDFQMGSTSADPFSDSSEQPQHTVYVSDFWIQRTEVSNADYAGCVSANGCAPPENGASTTRPDYFSNPTFANYPVVNVTYGEAAAFCAWAGGRLPTEAEWEKAARGTDGRRYPWGTERANRNLANYGQINQDTAPVVSYAAGASPYGLLNMGGNVWEWVADWFNPSYYSASPPRDPQGPTGGQQRVVRGGSWRSDGQFLRTTNRFAEDPAQGSVNVGFRCASNRAP